MRKITSFSIVVILVSVIAVLAIIVINKSIGNSSKKNKVEPFKREVRDSVAYLRLSPRQDTVLYLNKRKVLIKTPKYTKNHGTFLVLHGWNLPPDDWCTKTTLCEKAAEK